MADKVERWELREGPYIKGFELAAVRPDGTSYEIGIIARKCEEEGRLIVALHNAALDINPSNLMAVAEETLNLITACENFLNSFEYGCEALTEKGKDGILVSLRDAIQYTLAAITKPAKSRE
jgi:hypothetical protein